MNKEAMHCLARLLQARGRPVYCINYRRLPEAPWPACTDDCTDAAHFMLDGGLAAYGLPATGQVIVCGASAGGHLAMMTGLALGCERCPGIISLAGPSRVERKDDVSSSAICVEGFFERFFGTPEEPSAALLASASPSALVTRNAPPLWCIHSHNDRLVLPTHSEEAASAWRQAGIQAAIEYFDGIGQLHGFWTNDDIKLREPVEAVRSALLKIDSILP